MTNERDAPSIISDVGGERGAQPPVAWSLRRANSHGRAGTLAPRDRTLGQQGCPQHLSNVHRSLRTMHCNMYVLECGRALRPVAG